MTQPTLTGELPLLPVNGGQHGTLEFDEKKHRYTLDGEFVPSVTTALKMLPKDALIWWGMTIGVQGVLTLIERQELEVVDGMLAEPWEEEWNFLGADDLTQRLTAEKLTVNHIRDNAGTRGSAAHDQLEAFGKHGTALDPSKAPEDARGYVQAAASFLVNEEPEILATECMVWSKRERFAGTFDLLARTQDGRLGLGDYKTSKRVYDSHHLQLAAYEGARLEHGLEPVDFCFVIHLRPDGTYEIVETQATYEQFLAIKRAADAYESLTATLKPKRRK